MVEPCLISLLCGMLLGLRFKAFALVPLQVLALGLLAGLVSMNAVPFGRAAVFFICWSISLQAGYVLILMASSAMARPRRVTRVSKA